MRTLILYYSFSGRTMKICRNLQKNSGLDMEKLREQGHSLLPFFPYGFFRVLRGKGVSVMPITRDVAGSDRLVLAGPVWSGHPAPAIIGFLREYDVIGKEICALLTHSGKPGNAAALLRAEIETAGAVCTFCECMESDAKFLSQIENGRIQLALSLNGQIECLKKE